MKLIINTVQFVGGNVVLTPVIAKQVMFKEYPGEVFAVHRCPRSGKGWEVTHIASGLRASKMQGATRIDAIQLAGERLAGIRPDTFYKYLPDCLEQYKQAAEQYRTNDYICTLQPN